MKTILSHVESCEERDATWYNLLMTAKLWALFCPDVVEITEKNEKLKTIKILDYHEEGDFVCTLH